MFGGKVGRDLTGTSETKRTEGPVLSVTTTFVDTCRDYHFFHLTTGSGSVTGTEV